MKRNRYLIACLDEEDKINEMKEVYLLLIAVFFPQSRFKMDKSHSVISNKVLLFHFMTPDQMNGLSDEMKFCDVIGSKHFIEYGSFDSKHAFKYFKRKSGRVGSNGILQKLAKSREQSNR